MRPSRAWIPKKLTIWSTAAALALCVFPATAQDVQHGRVSYVDDDGLIKGTEDAEWSIAQLNSLVMPGDSIWADEDGVLEVEVSGGSFIRLADSSKIDVLSMPPDTRMRAYAGSFYVHRLRESEGDFTLETPVGDVQVGYDSQVRVDVLEEGAATVSVRWGDAVIHTGGTSTRVNSGQRVYIDPGYLPSAPEEIDRGHEDAFDTWNRERSRTIARGASSNRIGNGGSYATPIGAYDLADYGDWIEVDNQSYWRPTVIREYVPYRVGSWSYVPRHGHVWVGHHPFTYITSHHGYWHHHHHHGWIWSYHPVYSPAYVASVRYNDVFIWAPLGIHGDAVYASGSYFTAGGFRFSIGYSSFAYADPYLGGGYCHAYPVYNYHHVSHHHHYDAHHWNHYDHHSRHYRNRPKRNHHSGERDYTPRRVMRGPGSIDRGNGTIEARSRADMLENRVMRTGGNKPYRTLLADSRSTRTASQSTERSARARNISFNEDARTRIANHDTRLRSMPGDGSVTRTEWNNRTRGGDSKPSRTIVTKPGDNLDRERPNIHPGIGGNRQQLDNADGDNDRPNIHPTLSGRGDRDRDGDRRVDNDRPNVHPERPGTDRTTITTRPTERPLGIGNDRPNVHPERPVTDGTTVTTRPTERPLGGGDDRPNVHPERPNMDRTTITTRPTVNLDNRSVRDVDTTTINRYRETVSPRVQNNVQERPNIAPQVTTRPVVPENDSRGGQRVTESRPSVTPTTPQRQTNSSGPRVLGPEARSRVTNSSSSRTVAPQPRPTPTQTRVAAPEPRQPVSAPRYEPQQRSTTYSEPRQAPSQPQYNAPVSRNEAPRYEAPRSSDSSSSSRSISSSGSSRSSSGSSSSSSSRSGGGRSPR